MITLNYLCISMDYIYFCQSK